MWAMNHAGSDIDLFRAYIVPTKDILRGRMRLVPNVVYPERNAYTAKEPDINDVVLDGNSHFAPGGKTETKTDVSSHELAKVVNEILKNNANFVWGVFSPIVTVPDHGNAAGWKWFKEFRELSRACMSQLIYNPIMGMAVHNKQKYYDTGKDKGWRREKTARTIVRTCNFGVAVLQGRGFVFDPVPPLGEKEDDEVEASLARLRDARDKSSMLERPTAEAEVALREFILQTRIENLQEG